MLNIYEKLIQTLKKENIFLKEKIKTLENELTKEIINNETKKQKTKNKKEE